MNYRLIYLTIYSNGNPDIKDTKDFSSLEIAREYIRQNFPGFIEAGDNFFIKECDGEIQYLFIKEVIK